MGAHLESLTPSLLESLDFDSAVLSTLETQMHLMQHTAHLQGADGFDVANFCSTQSQLAGFIVADELPAVQVGNLDADFSISLSFEDLQVRASSPRLLPLLSEVCSEIRRCVYTTIA